MIENLPQVRGTLTASRNLADLTWMRVGGPADVLFQPADVDDLSAFMAALDSLSLIHISEPTRPY